MIYSRFAVVTSCLVLVFILLNGRVDALIQLKKYNVSVNTITTSGVSAGGYMAVQLHVAHSKTIKGAAVFAGGPWFCAQANLVIAEEECMDYYAGGPNVKYLVDLTVSQALLGGVDDPVNMKSHSLYLFGGVEDSVIDPRVVQALESYYKSFVSHGNIVGNYHVAAEHCMPTVDYGVNCETLASPYIGSCAFDGAGEGLKTLYGTGLKKGDAS
jgi:dienelactone hydrolase